MFARIAATKPTRYVHVVSIANTASESPTGHDIIVIGGSAGALDALFEITRALPAGLPASVFVVIHTHPEARTRIADLINDRSAVPSRLAVHGEPIERGRIYVAPPDNHLMLRPGMVTVYRGPKENGHRPAVDPLFRSAARHYGRRVVGVVLSGYQDCGSAGLVSIKARGGVAIVQSPSDAAVSDMPNNAAAQVDIDQSLPAREIGAAIAELANRPVANLPSAPVPNALRQMEGDEPGQPFGVVCPICAGTLTESHFRDSTQYFCHVGHSFSDASLVLEQAESLERALWAAARSLEESARLARRMAGGSIGQMRERMEEKAVAQEQQAKMVMRMLTGGGTLTGADTEVIEPTRDESGGSGSKRD